MKGTSGQSLLRFGTALVAIAMFGIGGTRLHGQSQAQNLASTQVRTQAEGWPKIFPKTSTTSRCRKTSGRLDKISCTSLQSITTLLAGLPERTLVPTSGRTSTTRRRTCTKRKWT